MEFPMHGNFYAPYRCASQRNMEYERSLFSIVLLFKGTWTLLYVPHRCTSQRNMEYERSLFLIVLLLKGTWTFPCSVSLYLSKEHWNFYIPHRCASQRSMEILCSSSLHCCASQRNIEFSMFHTVVSREGTWNVFWSLSFYYSKEHSKFYAPQRYAFQHGNFSAHYRLLLKWTWIFLFSISLFLSKEQWNFYGHYRLLLKWTWIFLFSISLFLYRNNEISMLINVLSLKVT